MDNENQTCPFLGLKDDPQTAVQYPTVWNICNHTRPSASPSLEHQRAFCLSGEHFDCPVFINPRREPMPVGMRAPLAQNPRRKWLPWLILLLLAAAAVAWGLWSLSAAHGGSGATPTGSPTQAAYTASPSNTRPAADLFPLIADLSTPTSSPSPTLTGTPTVTPVFTRTFFGTFRPPPTLTPTSGGFVPPAPSDTATVTATDTPTETLNPPTDTPVDTPTDTPTETATTGP